MNPTETLSTIKEKAPIILTEIQKASNILLHCHPSPDPDSVCSALAMKLVLEQMGKKATVIKGDTERLSDGFSSFPGFDDILAKNFGEINIKDFDLFIILDSGSPDRISHKTVPVFPLPIPTINIDHHKSNLMFADINLVDVGVSTTYILFNLFCEWKINITHDIALNLFVGMYTDSGGFKYAPMDYSVFEVAAELTRIAPDFTETIFIMENSQSEDSIRFEALALNSVKTYFNGSIAIATVSFEDLKKNNIDVVSINSDIPNKLKSVLNWSVGMTLVEVEPGIIKLSMRSKDVKKFDVSKLAVVLGGGGHRAAAGVRFTGINLDQAIEKVVSTAKDLYNL